MTATRRLAAIMAIDVVGYSRLMGEDEAVSRNLRVARRMDNILPCRKHSQ
jgi:class 3 adenylate cyclase